MCVYGQPKMRFRNWTWWLDWPVLDQIPTKISEYSQRIEFGLKNMAHMIPIWAIYMYATYYVATLNGHHFCNQMDVNSSILWLWLYKLCSHKLILNSWMFKNWLVEESIQNEMCDTKNVFYILKSVSLEYFCND